MSVIRSAAATASSSAAVHRESRPWWGLPPARDQVGHRDALRAPPATAGAAPGPARPAWSACRCRSLPSSTTWPERGAQQPRHGPQQRGLAAGVGPDDDRDPAGGHGEVQGVDDDPVAVAEGDVADLEGVVDGSQGASGAVGADEQVDEVRRAEHAGDRHRRGSGRRRRTDRPGRPASTSSAPASAAGTMQRAARADEPGAIGPDRKATKAIGPAAAVAKAMSPTAVTIETSAGALHPHPERRGRVVAVLQQVEVAALREQDRPADHGSQRPAEAPAPSRRR